MNRARWLAAAVIVVIAGAIAYRLFLHSSTPPTPAIITPTMDVHRTVSTALDARIDRLLHDRYSGDRSHRPRLIALTFDDGPYPVTTPLLLARLHDLHIPATFFLIGRDAIDFPELTKRIERFGNEIGNHTYSHPNLDQLSSSDVGAQLTKGRDVLRSFVGDPGIGLLFRPPHGRYTEATLQTAQRLGYDTVLWNDDPGDWRAIGPQALASHIEAHATAPEIILLHSGNLATIAILPEVVERFRKSGYEFVTVSELLKRASLEEMNHPARRAV
ncbi:MAG: polysaccharide deacetylase family protein [Candidatus Eremiobacteraeota bacterium]|nr:polysaccharide deacetylase family protein [Candidatus Eremiobacteraeota bacterium]